MGGEAPTYDLYGLRVRSDLPLPAPLHADPAEPDLAIRRDEPRAIPDVPPPGELIAELRWGARGYALARTATGYTYRFYSICDLEIDAGWREARLHLARSSDAEHVAILLSASVPALMLSVRGECILHASAVATEVGAIALVGRSGAGKSTLAAILCAAGSDLIADDVVRVDLGHEPPRCFEGPSEVRLRRHARGLLDLFDHPDWRETRDDRIALVCRRKRPRARRPLRALVFPRVDRSASPMMLERLAPARALEGLVGAPRIAGLMDPAALRAQFHNLAALARRVTAYSARVPWGPPFSTSIGSMLFRDLRGDLGPEISVSP